MGSFHIVCKKRKGLSMKNLKVLILSVLQRIRVRKKKKDEAAKGPDQKNLRKVKTIFFCKKPGHKKKMYKISCLACQKRYVLYFGMF